MRRRCLDPNHAKYADYGGRGITVCEAWAESFESFFDHIGLRPGPGYSLDRINNDRGYEPGNVRWATASQQNKNRRQKTWEPHEPEQLRWLSSLGYSDREIARFFRVDHKTVRRAM